MAKFKLRQSGVGARTLDGGATLAPGESITLTDEQAEQPTTAALIAEGELEEEAPPKAKAGKSAASAGTANMKAKDKAPGKPATDTTGGNDR